VVYVVYALYQICILDFKQLIKNYCIVLKYSSHVLIGGILIYFITVSGRILIEFFLNDYELVGIYAFYFRLSALVVMVHQVINIVFFKKMYLLNPKILDHYFSICFGGLYIVSISIFVLVPYILPYFSEFYETTENSYKGVYFLLCSQMVFWIATALFSNIIDREKLANNNNKLLLILLAVFLIILWVIKLKLTIQIFTSIHMFVVFLAALIQIYSLTKKQIFFKKSFYSIIGVNLFSLIVYLFSF
jgi:O-antigen/teichoic acid export membrane protein